MLTCTLSLRLLSPRCSLNQETSSVLVICFRASIWRHRNMDAEWQKGFLSPCSPLPSQFPVLHQQRVNQELLVSSLRFSSLFRFCWLLTRTRLLSVLLVCQQDDTKATLAKGWGMGRRTSHSVSPRIQEFYLSFHYCTANNAWRKKIRHI